jgi:phosphate:Na+ symporter
MTTTLQVFGGIGLFLLGLIVMTQGLRELEGGRIRAALIRFTRSPYSGAATGAISTAILQSSSATTVAAIGFVSAGLMSFPSALGILFGANIGTTITGWLVALLGLKLKFGDFILPLVFVGAILRLFGNRKISSIGMAVAGFSLIFVGISQLQLGMEGASKLLSPDMLATDSIFGVLKLVALGMVFTVITQSSSAGVAAALTAVYTGAINFEQAAAIVIGMDVGTTIKAAIATIGGSVATRRTGFSHVIYNCFTGVGALFLIYPYILVWEAISPGALAANPEIGLVAFHTTFNTLGVIVVLPITGRFARLMERVVPGKAPIYTHRLERNLLQDPVLALKAVMPIIYAELIALLRHITVLLGDKTNGEKTDLAELQTALDETQAFVDEIRLASGDGVDWEQLLAVIHILDHMQRLHERCEEDEDRAATARKHPEFNKEREIMLSSVRQVIENIEATNWIDAAHAARQAVLEVRDNEDVMRTKVMKQIANKEIEMSVGTSMLQAIRWLGRVSNHIDRITDHLNQSVIAAGK